MLLSREQGHSRSEACLDAPLVVSSCMPMVPPDTEMFNHIHLNKMILYLPGALISLQHADTQSSIRTSLVASILVAGQTFQVNLTPSLSSFWLIKSAHVAISFACQFLPRTTSIFVAFVYEAWFLSEQRCALIRRCDVKTPRWFSHMNIIW